MPKPKTQATNTEKSEEHASLVLLVRLLARSAARDALATSTRKQLPKTKEIRDDC